MPAKPNLELIRKIENYYNINIEDYDKDEIGTIEKLINGFRKSHPEVKRASLTLRKYFSHLIKGLDLTKSAHKRNDEITSERDGLIIEETQSGKLINYKGDQPITNIEQAIKFFKIDTRIWEVGSGTKFKSWTTSMNIKETDEQGRQISKPVRVVNYGAIINLVRKISEVDYKKIYKNINVLYKNYPKIARIEGSNIGVLTIADIHLGLKVTKKGGIVNTPESNVDNVIRYLNEVAYKVNQMRYDKLYVVILGDLVESVSGYNHIETLKEMESTVTGGSIIILAYEVISKFIAKLNNVQEVELISGNHDRLTPDKAMDKDGGACQVIAYMLNMSVKTNWHPFIITKEIDNIRYILTHGHLKISSQDLGKIAFEYGDQNKYNVILSAHWHVRQQTRVFNEKKMIMADTFKYRAIVVSPITTGTRWTEENGWSCTPGFTITEANDKKTNINYLDMSLN